MINPNDVKSVRASHLATCAPENFLEAPNADEVLAVPIYAGSTWEGQFSSTLDVFHATTGSLDRVPDYRDKVEGAVRELFKYVLKDRPRQKIDMARFVKRGDTDVYMYIALYYETEEKQT